MRFSIIIPTRNRPMLLDTCLAAIGALNYPRDDFEVVVVDDGTNPDCKDVIGRHMEHLVLKYDWQTQHGPARARNRGLRIARGEYVVFTDDDCAPDEGWLKAFDEAFKRWPAAGLGGCIENAPGDGISGIASQMLVGFLYEYAAATPGSLRFFCANNVAFPRDALLGIGGFDDSFPFAAAEDRDVCARWLRQKELHYVPEAVVKHRQDLQLSSFCSQQYRYGRGAYHFWMRQRARGEAGPSLKRVRFCWRMLRWPFARQPFFKAAAIAMLLGLSQVACLAGYISERRTDHKRRAQGPRDASIHEHPS